MKKTLILIFAFLTLSFSANSMTIQDLKLNADEGNGEAQYNLGSCDEEREGVKMDYYDEVDCSRLPSDQGLKETKDDKELSTTKAANKSKKGSDVDSSIPQSVTGKETNTFAIIIANENYRLISQVPFAINDGEILEQYLIKTVGLPADHVTLYKNASLENMLEALEYVENIATGFGEDLNLIFYYSGHGIAEEWSKNAMLIPVDGDVTVPESCYEVNRLISRLGGLGAGSVIVMLDACFSGTERGDKNLVESAGLRPRPNPLLPSGNMVIISAAGSGETAFPYEAGQHGLFTYYLLKNLQDNGGDVTLGELCDYITKKVQHQSVVINHKLQTPTVVVSPTLAKNWRDLKLKN